MKPVKYSATRCDSSVLLVIRVQYRSLRENGVISDFTETNCNIFTKIVGVVDLAYFPECYESLCSWIDHEQSVRAPARGWSCE